MFPVINASQYLDLYRSGLPVSVQATVQVYWEDPESRLPGLLRARVLGQSSPTVVLYESPSLALAPPFSDHPSMLVTCCVPDGEDPSILCQYASGMVAILQQSILLSNLGFWHVGEPTLVVQVESRNTVRLGLLPLTPSTSVVTWRHRDTDIIIIMDESDAWWVDLAWTIAGGWTSHWERSERIHQLVMNAVNMHANAGAHMAV